MSTISLSGQARIAGACYLLVIAGGVFAALFVREALFVQGDAAATAGAITESESLWRWGIAIHLLYLVPAATANVILYRLFRPAGPTLALLALVLALAAVVIEAVLLTTLQIPLALVQEGASLDAFDDGQRAAIGYLAVRLFLSGWGFSLLLFAGFCVLIGVLILRSRLVPVVIGGLMIAAGVGYVVNTLAGILSPPFAVMLLPWVLLPAFVGELSLALWLTVKGIRSPDGVLP